MPCISDYMEQTVAERQRCEAAKLYIYAAEAMKRPVPEAIRQALKDAYPTSDEPMELLCKLIRGMTDLQMDTIVYNSRNPAARWLAGWWDEHKEEDAKRAVIESKQRIATALDTLLSLSEAELVDLMFQVRTAKEVLTK